MTKNIHKLAKVPPSIASANAWKPPPPSSSQNAAPYPAATAAYYAHHHAYGMPWYGSWSQQAAAAAYYNRAIHATNHPHAGGYPPHAPHHPAMTTGVLVPKLPPTSPLLLSPKRNERKTPPTEATTPYHEVEDIVKSPMRALTDGVSTPVFKDKRGITSSPDTDLLPPLWSTCTKPTPATSSYAPQSPWSEDFASPSHLVMTSTPAPDADWNFSSLGYHDTPCLPTTTPVKTSSEIDAWHSAGAATPRVV